MTSTTKLNAADDAAQLSGRLAVKALTKQRYDERAALTDACRRAELKSGSPVFGRLDCFHEHDRVY